MLNLSQNSIAGDVGKYVNKATMLIHSKETSDAVLQSLAGKDPVKSVASLTVMVMQRLDSVAREAGVETKDSVKVIGAHAIVEMLCELGTVANKFKITEEYKQLAFSVALQDYFKSEIQSGRIDPVKFKESLNSYLKDKPPSFLKEIQGVAAKIPALAQKYNQGNAAPKAGV